MSSLLERVKKAGLRGFANDNIASVVTPDDLKKMEEDVIVKLREVFEILAIDQTVDHNTADTPRRIAKMWVRELFHGRYTAAPRVTDFPNDKNYDGLLMVGPLSVKSLCAHHFAEIVGTCYIGVMPGTRVIGLSKYARIVEWFCRRPQIQEELTQQIAHFLMEKMDAKGVMVFIQAKHHCMTHRGVEESNSETTTSVVLGEFRVNPSLKAEFFELVKLAEMK